MRIEYISSYLVVGIAVREALVKVLRRNPWLNNIHHSNINQYIV